MCCFLVVGTAEFSVSFARLAVVAVVALDSVLVSCGGADVCGGPVGVAPQAPPTDVAGHSAGAVVSGHSAGTVGCAHSAGLVACAHSAGAAAVSGGGSDVDGHGLAARVFDQEF